jgi:hypothetical protein
LPPKREVAGSTVGVEPRTPQKVSLVMGELISVGNALRTSARLRLFWV